MAQLAEKEHTYHAEYQLVGAYLVIALVVRFVGVVTGLFPGPVTCRRESLPTAHAGGSLVLPGAHCTWSHERPRLDHVFYLWLLATRGDASARHAVGAPQARLGRIRAHDELVSNTPLNVSGRRVW